MDTKRMTYAFASLLLVAVNMGTLQAGVRTDFRVNSDAGNAEQNWPRIAVLPNHSFFISWVDWRNGTSDIYIQRFGTDGLPVGVNTRVNDDSPDSYQFEPALAVASTGEPVVAWKDYRNDVYP